MGTNLSVLTDFLAAWQDDWQAACRTYVSEDFECIEPPELPQGGVFTGWDAPIKVSSIYQGIWNIEVLDHQFFDEEGSGTVVSRYLIKWTSKETGKSMTQPVVELNQIVDGKISRMEVFHFNAAGLLATLQP
jgi:hypothetical protein